MVRYFLTLSYNGTQLNGWQIQKNTPHTVQQILEEKMQLLLKEKIEIVGCGRTDTGVNAKNYIAHFDSVCTDLTENKKHWIYKLNTVLPTQISIHNIQKVKPEAHARFDAISRTYFYHTHIYKNPFINNFSLQLHSEIDFELMNKAAKILLEYNDFTSFSKLHTQNKTNLCTITKAMWQKTNVDQWRFTITANRFLRGMVRAIVGTLLLVGKGKITIDDFRKIIEAKNRNVAGNNVDPHALFLVSIKYPKDIFID